MTPPNLTATGALLIEMGETYRHHRAKAEEVRELLAGYIREAAATGMSESEIARLAGVTRMTVRKALGK